MRDIELAVNDLIHKVQKDGMSENCASLFVNCVESAILVEKDVEYALKISKYAKQILNKQIIKETTTDIFGVSEVCRQNNASYTYANFFWTIMRLEAPYLLDSFWLYIEKNKPEKKQLYLPRRKTLKRVVDKLQDLEDDKLDILFVHQPPRTGKSLCMTVGGAWHGARNPMISNLYITYKESLGGSYIDALKEIYTDPSYLTLDVFKDLKVVNTDARGNKLDLNKKKKYWSWSGKGLESGLNGEYDCEGWFICDDIIEGIQDARNPETLLRKQTIFDNNALSRVKENAKEIYNGTIWSLKDIFSNRLDFLQNNEQAEEKRIEVLKLPALDEHDKSNFDYKHGVGFSTQFYLMKRANFEENDDMASWLAQYQQEPIEREGQVFNKDNLKFYNGELPVEEPLKIVCACDVALGGADYLSCPLAYVYEDNSVYIHDVVFDNSEKDITQPQVADMIHRNNCKNAFFESNQGGELYKDEVDKMLQEKYKEKINITSRYAPTNKRKEQRIFDKAPEIRQFYFRDVGCRSPQYRKFMTNLYEFTINGKGKRHDDAPDSLSTLASFITSGSGARVEVIKNPLRGGYF